MTNLLRQALYEVTARKECCNTESVLGRDEGYMMKYSLSPTQPSECGRQRTLNTVHAQTAAQQQSNGSYEARMPGKC